MIRNGKDRSFHMFQIREYQPSDETGWLECRVLSFLDTDYYDDVRTDRSSIQAPCLSLVAESEGKVVGLIDIEMDGTTATIDSLAVHPVARQEGLASVLLDEALDRLPPEMRELDAWTREDAAANSWYKENGFVEAYRYLHVYKSHEDPDEGFQSPVGLSRPVGAFMHADIKHEHVMRRKFKRVYVCRQYVLKLYGT